MRNYIHTVFNCCRPAAVFVLTQQRWPSSCYAPSSTSSHVSMPLQQHVDQGWEPIYSIVDSNN